ncbi:MAG: exodeoxyribonuclease III [Clostridiales bacterium]|nr:exodeoxyribonuclease III [Clostridiales bacterium]
MKLVSWNVNGLRACVKKGFEEYFSAEDADFFCIQETKLQPDQIDLDPDGYQVYWNSAERKGYSGTAVFTKHTPSNVAFGIGIEEHDNEGRVITLEFADFYLVTVYTPNSQDELRRLDYRMTWEDAFAKYLKALDAKKPVVVCGDMNVAHQEIDLKNPKTNVNNAGFTPQEREKMTRLLSNGFVDTFRLLHPDETDRYSWWSYRMNARDRNVGWRIDYFLVSKRIADKIIDADIEDQVTGSDHCPVTLELDLP